MRPGQTWEEAEAREGKRLQQPGPEGRQQRPGGTKAKHICGDGGLGGTRGLFGGGGGRPLPRASIAARQFLGARG